MWLETSTSEQIRRYLERSRTIVLPMGSTEQHGPIGLIGTDSICARAVAQGLAERSEVLIAPAITLTVAQFNMGFPGTIAVRAATLLALLNDVLHALADQGFDRIYVLNGHGANIAVARAAFQDFYLERQRRLPGVPSARCRLRSWWEFAEVNALRSAWYGEFEGLHATPSEIAITMAAEPQACERARAEGAERAIAAPAAPSSTNSPRSTPGWIRWWSACGRPRWAIRIFRRPLRRWRAPTATTSRSRRRGSWI